jgi:pimeloyl-ACP methyl ester carboxylesterase
MRVEVGGLSIAYERAGSGPPVVLAHGFVGDGVSTRGRQIDALADEFTVVAWDAPGAGGSDDPPNGFGMDEYADCFAAFLRALCNEPAHLVGLSFGGALVLATFQRHDDIASSLTLVSGHAGWLGSLGPADAQQRLTRSLEVSELPADEFTAAMLPSMFSPSATDEMVASFVDSVRAFRPAGLRAMARASFEDQSHVLPEVDVPVLLLRPRRTRARGRRRSDARCPAGVPPRRTAGAGSYQQRGSPERSDGRAAPLPALGQVVDCGRFGHPSAAIKAMKPISPTSAASFRRLRTQVRRN